MPDRKTFYDLSKDKPNLYQKCVNYFNNPDLGSLTAEPYKVIINYIIGTEMNQLRFEQASGIKTAEELMDNLYDWDYDIDDFIIILDNMNILYYLQKKLRAYVKNK